MNTNTRALTSLLSTPNAAGSEARATNATVTATAAPGMDFASLMGARVQAAQSAQASAAQRQQSTPSDASHRSSTNTTTQDQTRALHERRERERVQDRAAENRTQQAATAARQQAARNGSAQQANAGKPATTEAEAASKGEDSDNVATEDKPLATTPLAEWLASLNPATMQLPPARGDGSSEGPLEAVDGQERPLAGAQRNAAGLRRGTNAAGTDAAGETNSTTEKNERFESPAQTQAALETQAATSSARTEGATPMATKSNPDTLAAVTNLTAPTPGTSSTGEAQSPPVVGVPTPTTDADFPDVLATQVSVLVKDGVQQAELHLNPAEMGPISVQIAVDGSQAQVDFAAATGATRELIETSLPMLAAALHEAGLTLAGGGVFEHGRQHTGGAGHDGASSRSSQGGGNGRDAGSVEGAAAPQPAARRVAARGMLDLYA